MPHQYQIGIVCPQCMTPQTFLPSAEETAYTCKQCGTAYSMQKGVLDLLPEFPGRRTLSHRLMEWEPLIAIYNSRWYRYSPVAAWLFGLSFDEEYALIADIAGLHGQELVLDVACGPGTYTRPFADHLPAGFVVGIDLSLPMLSYASEQARRHAYGNVLFVHGHAEQLPFPDGEFDHLNCCGALHLFSDLPAALSEIRRVLKPGGKLTATAYRNWIPGATAKKLAAWHYRHLGTNYFHTEDLMHIMQESGFDAVECHHDTRYWMILSAGKPT